MKTLHFLDLGSMPIFEQLQIEEGLLRASHLNVCLISRGTPRAIVMGISGNPETHLNIASIKRDQIPVIKRFSGGGTVVVDEQTFFVTFICQKDFLPIHPFPEPILRWGADLFAESWKIPDFQLLENDYVIGDLKCGGNAQYITKDRWLHHTSFLWDYRDENMNYLLLPPKRPRYRRDRPHHTFLCRLKEFAPSKDKLLTQLHHHLGKQFKLQPLTPDQITWGPHRKAAQWIEL
ncbi:MAG: lipoate--protein ligase family protein [Verrucomicrobiota bacterium]|nr:lipoate--protein ligase family protein [Verrucomicrobiota bacterium]